MQLFDSSFYDYLRRFAKRRRWVASVLLLHWIVLSACVGTHVPATSNQEAQTVFSISENTDPADPTTFRKIDWSQADKITIQGLWLEKYPVFIGEMDSRNIFPFYMANSVVLGSLPVISADGNYLAFQTDGKLHIAMMNRVVSDQYAISPESIISILDLPGRCDFAWSQNSHQLALVCVTIDEITISLFEPGGDELQSVFQYYERDIDEIEGVTWSADATALAFSIRYRRDEGIDKKSQKDIFIYYLNTYALVRITNSPNNNEQDPDWYPANEILVFTLTEDGAVESTDARLVFSTKDGKCAKQVPNIRGIVSPSWSPDGSQMAYISQWKSIKIIETSKLVPPNFLSPEELCSTSN